MKPSAKIAKEATISLVGMGFGTVVRYVFTALLARMIGAHYLGIYSLANAVTRIMEVIGKAGLDGGILLFVSRRDADEKEIIHSDIATALKLGFILSLLVMSIQIAISGWLTSSVFSSPQLLKTVLLVNAIGLPFSIVALIAANATQAFKLLKYKILVNDILNPLVLLLAMLGAYFLISSEAAIILPALLSAAIGFIVIMLFLFRMTGIQAARIIHQKIEPGLLSFSYPLMFIGIIATMTHWMDVMMLGYFHNEETVGLYLPAVRTAGLLRIVLVAFAGIFAPMLAQLHKKNDTAETDRLYKLVIRWISSIVLPLAIIVLLFPQKVMLIFGAEFRAASDVLVILIIATLIHSILGLGQASLTMTGHPKVNLINSIIVLATNAILNYFWIPRYGLTGAALATATAICLMNILVTAEMWIILRLQPVSFKFFKPVIAGVGAFLITSQIKPLIMPMHTVLTLAAGAITVFVSFGLILWLFRFDDDDKEILTGLSVIKKSAAR